MLSRLIVLACVILRISCNAFSSGEKYTFGKQAEIMCQAYKKTCPLGKVCALQQLHWPRKMTFPVCVFQQELEVKSRICELPPAPGGCGARFRRWYFNVNARSCAWFTYGGCEGNLNNFRDEDSCKRTCQPEDLPEIKTESSNVIIHVTPRLTHVTPRVPQILPALAPAPLMMRASEVREALGLRKTMDPGLEMQLKVRRKFKHRRRQKKNRKNKRRRRKGRKLRKHRTMGPYAELRVRKTEYRSEKAQNDQAEKLLKRMNRRRNRMSRKHRRHRGKYYDNIRLFTLLNNKYKAHTSAES